MDGANLLTQISTLFTNFNSIFAAVWAGVILILGFIFILGTSRDMLPALFDKELRQSPKYKEGLESLYRKIAIILTIALLPVFIPLLISFLGGASSFVSSFTNISK